MKGEWICTVLLLVASCMSAVASAEEATKKEAGSAETQATGTSVPDLTAVSGRKEIEALLRSPAKLDFSGRTNVSGKEILDQLREQHQLSIRFDLPTFAWFLGAEAVISEVAIEKANGLNQEEIPPAQATVPAADSQSPVAETAPPQETVTVESHNTNEPSGDSEHPLQSLFLIPIDIGTMNLRTARIETVLKHVLGSIPISASEATGMPIPLTHAMTLDYIIEEDGILITTHLQAMALKETRVYSVKNLKDYQPEQLSTLIRRTIRPYSWRAQFDDFGDKLKGVSLPSATLASLVQTGMMMTDLEGVTVTATDNGAVPVTAPSLPQGPDVTEEQVKAAGNALANVLVAFTHAGLLTVEMVHHGDPPTGVIEVLPGKLIVTQSQGAHREIAELLEALAAE